MDLLSIDSLSDDEIATILERAGVWFEENRAGHSGDRLNGKYVLVRMKPRKEDRGRQNWLLIKKRDEYAGDGNEPTQEFETSVKSGRTMDQILYGESAVWTSNAAERAKKLAKPARSKRAVTAKPRKKPAAR